MRALAERLARKVVPTVPVLSQKRPLMMAVDAFDRAVSFPFPELRGLPPNRMRIRVGVGNRLLFNQIAFLEYGSATLVDLMARGYMTLASIVVDIGCGCGRFAHALSRFGFSGRYEGIDVDREMLAWCRAHFDPDVYRFHFADAQSSVYNPTGSREPYRLPLGESSSDLVLGQSVFTHLLEDDLRNYVAESARVLRSGGHMLMGVFALEEMDKLGQLGGRWTFKHRVGSARVESIEYPEAAVAYPNEFLLAACRDAGFQDMSITRRAPQSILLATK